MCVNLFPEYLIPISRSAIQILNSYKPFLNWLTRALVYFGGEDQQLRMPYSGSSSTEFAKTPASVCSYICRQFLLDFWPHCCPEPGYTKLFRYVQRTANQNVYDRYMMIHVYLYIYMRVLLLNVECRLKKNIANNECFFNVLDKGLLTCSFHIFLCFPDCSWFPN